MVLIASSLLLDQDTEFWADSESDTADDSDDLTLSNYDPELGGKGAEVWRCINCNEPNTPHMRLCSRCWKVSKHGADKIMSSLYGKSQTLKIGF